MIGDLRSRTLCADGRKYELKFDADFVFRGKKADD